MAESWSQERTSASEGADSRSGRAAVPLESTAPLPVLLDQQSRFLLSPVPASMAQKTAAAASALFPSSSSSVTPSSSAITLYPVESVPSHLLCAICTLPYENPVHFLPCCHVFCLECIQLWIGMNLGDDLLQNELRRAYPAEGDVIPGDLMGGALPGYEDMQMPYLSQQQQPLQQQFMFELARMGDSRSRSGTATSLSSFYDSFSHLTPAQQQLLQQQQNQQRIAILLESREMPKCPMCRTGLHINGWDRIEEQIKVPVSVSHRPRPTNTGSTSTPPLSSSAEWQELGGIIQGQRPVSGVQRRRARTDRFTPSGTSRRGQEAIGEEEEGDDEEIEMEHVRTSRNRGNNNNNTFSPHPSFSASLALEVRHHDRTDRTDRIQHRHLDQPTVHTERRLLSQDNLDGNDEEEPQSPTTAVIGRRPSEWMRYQQRQIQAHQEQQQANRLRANAAAATAAAEAASDMSDLGDTPHPHVVIEDRFNEQQEQIRRLYLEQESQEELLRTLTARAASIIEEQEQSRRQESNSASPTFAATVVAASMRNSIHQRTAEQGQSERQEGEEIDEAQVEHLENETGILRPQPRHSLLQIDTSRSRPSSRQSQEGHNSSTHSRQVSREITHPLESEITQNSSAEGAATHPQSGSHPESSSHSIGEGGNDSDNNSIADAMQQGTRAWGEHPSSLRLDLEDQGQRPLMLSLDDGESEMGVSDSVSDSTRSSSGTQSPSMSLSPSNESALSSYRTSSTFSQNIQNHTSVSTPTFSQRSSTHHHQWERHSLSLQMPTFESGSGDPEGMDSRRTLDNLAECEHGNCSEQPWGDHNVHQHDNDDANCHKDLHAELARADSDNISCGSSTPLNDTLPVDKGDASEAPAESVTSGSAVDSLQGSSTGATLGSNLLSSSSSNWKAQSSLISPLLRDLDIHSPIVTAEGSTRTIADMQIDADILARARSNSILLSDEDSPHLRERPSPVDSPIPTPSTARPRNRFPAGISLAGEEEDEDQEEGSEDIVLEEQDFEQGSVQDMNVVIATSTPSVLTFVAEETHVAGQEAALDSREGPHNTVLDEDSSATEFQAEDEVTALSAVTVVPPTSFPDPSIIVVEDPLSATISHSEPSEETPPEAEQDHTHGQADIIPLARPSRATMSSPPPLPLPLPVAVEEHEVAQNSSTSPVRELSDLRNDTHSNTSDRLRPRSISSDTGMSTRGDLGVEPFTSPAPYPTLLSSSEAPSYDPRDQAAPTHPHPSTMRPVIQEHIQYRTLVRYQPRLPKAHVMADLICQIKVECPHRDFGCVETMEMQRLLQHGRDQCQFRRVMCPRARCGLYMRADQILEHILMVEQPSGGDSSSSSVRNSSSSSSSVLSPSSSDLSNASNASVRSTGRSDLRQGNNANGSTQQRSLRGQRNQSNNNSNTSINPAKKQHPDISTSISTPMFSTSSSSPLIPPCPGLTWEREQLTRATGIIGQLNEENTSLRQMIRQLTSQNSKLMKDKDRWQRYANIGPPRD